MRWLALILLIAPRAGEARRHGPFGKIRDINFSLTATQAEILSLSPRNGARLEVTTLGEVGGHAVRRIDITPARPRLRVLVAAGVHGNEPAGVAAALALARRALSGHELDDVQLTIVPMVNPTGLGLRTRENAAGADVNRSFRPGHLTPESRLLMGALRGERFDLFLDLHGATRRGFFLIRGRDDGGLSTRALRVLDRRLLLRAGRVGPYRLAAPGEAVSSNPGTFKDFMLENGTALAYTAEYPRRLAPERQVPGMLELVRSTIDNFRQRPPDP